MKLYLGHVAIWMLISLILNIRAAIKSKKTFEVPLVPLVFLSMFMGLITYLIHWGFFL
jgi:hypothetical protein